MYSINFGKKIYNIKNNLKIKNSNISFSGIKNKTEKCVFAFDLDGTLANGNASEISKIINTSRERNATLIYATGRNITEVYKLQNELKEKGIVLPTPDFLVSNNGQFVFENIDGKLIKDNEYESLLKEKTNFSAQKVRKILQKLSQREDYLFSENQLKEMQGYKNFDEIKNKDPLFWNSKISYYEWNASEFMCEYFVAKDISPDKFETDVVNELSKEGIKTKFIVNTYSKKIMDKCRTSILLQSHPIRRKQDGSMQAIFLCPADKSVGLEFIRKKLEIPKKEVLIAGNDDNDVSLSNMGCSFICLKNSSEILKENCKKIANDIYFSTRQGAQGIIEGIKYFCSR